AGASVGNRIVRTRPQRPETHGRRATYWEDTSTVLHQLQRAAIRALAGDEGVHRLNIVVPSAFANFWLVPRLGSFVESHRDIMLSLTNRVDAENAFTGDDDA